MEDAFRPRVRTVPTHRTFFLTQCVQAPPTTRKGLEWSATDELLKGGERNARGFDLDTVRLRAEDGVLACMGREGLDRGQALGARGGRRDTPSSMWSLTRRTTLSRRPRSRSKRSVWRRPPSSTTDCGMRTFWTTGSCKIRVEMGPADRGRPRGSPRGGRARQLVGASRRVSFIPKCGGPRFIRRGRDGRLRQVARTQHPPCWGEPAPAGPPPSEGACKFLRSGAQPDQVRPAAGPDPECMSGRSLVPLTAPGTRATWRITPFRDMCVPPGSDHLGGHMPVCGS